VNGIDDKCASLGRSEIAFNFDAYRPSTDWYAFNAEGLHGLSHSARVLIWADLIARWMQQFGSGVDLEVVRWAAVLHDVRRIHDGSDPRHGERASRWLSENTRLLPATIDDAQRSEISYCCSWHVPHDHEAPDMSAELTCLKDADGLDRVRLNGLDPRFLRTSLAKSMCASADSLFRATQYGTGSAWDRVRDSAEVMGLWSISPAKSETNRFYCLRLSC
jgi:hypothetical protein